MMREYIMVNKIVSNCVNCYYYGKKNVLYYNEDWGVRSLIFFECYIFWVVYIGLFFKGLNWWWWFGIVDFYLYMFSVGVCVGFCF